MKSDKQISKIKKDIEELKLNLLAASDSVNDYNKTLDVLNNCSTKLDTIYSEAYNINERSKKREVILQLKQISSDMADWFNNVPDFGVSYTELLFSSHTSFSTDQVDEIYNRFLYLNENSEKYKTIYDKVKDFEELSNVKVTSNNSLKNQFKKQRGGKIAKAAATITLILALAAGGTTFGILYKNEKDKNDDLEKKVDELENQGPITVVVDQFSLSSETRKEIEDVLVKASKYSQEEVVKMSDTEIFSAYMTYSKELANTNTNNSTEINDLKDKIAELEGKMFDLDDITRDNIYASLVASGYSPKDVKDMTDKELVEAFVEIQKELQNDHSNLTPDEGNVGNIDEHEPTEPVDDEKESQDAIIDEHEPSEPSEEDIYDELGR